MASLLPWYLNGTLDEEERRLVEAHVVECQDCQGELQELDRLWRGLKEAARTEPGPSPDLFRRVLARIELAEATGKPESRIGEKALPWWARLEAWLQTLFSYRRAPALATALIVIQLAVIGGLVGVLLRERPERFETLTGPRVERPGSETVALLRVAFQERSPEREIRALLQELGGRIVDGPSAAGFYVVAVPAPDPAALDKVLATLQARSDLIRFAGPFEW